MWHRVDAATLFHEFETLVNAEAMLFVHNHEGEADLNFKMIQLNELRAYSPSKTKPQDLLGSIFEIL